MSCFEQISQDVYVLKTPFNTQWASVVLIRGDGNFLIDSGASSNVAQEVIVPALATIGLAPTDIGWLLATHSHGDHVGGHACFKSLSGAKVVYWGQWVEKLRNPMKYSKLIRSAYPEHSPDPPAVLDGVDTDVLLDDGAILAGRLQLVAAPGHDTDCICWLDIKTNTLIAGDSLQLNGTAGQGMALYNDYTAYRTTIAKIRDLQPQTIIAGHDYLPLGYLAVGKKAVTDYLDSCESISNFYTNALKQYIADGIGDKVQLATRMIADQGLSIPEKLFLALYTVDAHLHHIAKEKNTQ